MSGNTLAFIGDRTLTWLDGPVIAVVTAVWLYWFTVIVMSFVRRYKTGKRGAIKPRQQADRWLLRVMALVIIAWNAFPAVALRKGVPPWGPFEASYEMPLLAVRWVGAIGAVFCLAVTAYCWYEMGKNWSVAIVEEDEDQQLVTTGLFRLVRHPIYALSALMVVCTAIACASWPMALVAVIHCTLFRAKAKREEQALVGVFGEDYTAYMQRTGRFIPRLLSR